MSFFLFKEPILSESLDVSLSKLAWAPSGHHIACGDIDGRVYIYEAGEVRGGAKGRPGSHVVVWMRVHLCDVVPVVMTTLFLPPPLRDCTHLMWMSGRRYNRRSWTFRRS